MKPVPFIIVGVYILIILLYVLTSVIFSAMLAFFGEKLAAYAIIAYVMTIFLMPISVLKILYDSKDEGKITCK